MQTILALVLSYLVGSIPTGAIVGRLRGVDLRKEGRGNLRFTNALRVLGPRAGIPVLIVDVGKGIVAVLVFAAIPGADSILGTEGIGLACGLAAVAGHIWPVFAGFRGGKGVATACGVFLAMAPAATAVVVAVWLVIVFASRYVSLGSITAAAVLPIAIAVQGRLTGERQPLLLTAAIVVAAAVILRHRGNIKRLIEGTESRFGRSAE